MAESAVIARPEPLVGAGVLSVMHDVSVVQTRGDEMVIEMDAPIGEGEDLLLALPSPDGRQQMVRGQVVGSELFSKDGLARHAVRLRILESIAAHATSVRETR